MVVNKVTWLHEVVYSTEGKPATYKDLSIPLFVKGYNDCDGRGGGCHKDKMATHLEELMADTQNCTAGNR